MLSGREREVLQLMAEGWSTKEIAAELRISVKTVETYQRLMKQKLALDNVADLTKYALRHNITGP